MTAVGWKWGTIELYIRCPHCKGAGPADCPGCRGAPMIPVGMSLDDLSQLQGELQRCRWELERLRDDIRWCLRDPPPPSPKEPPA